MDEVTAEALAPLSVFVADDDEDMRDLVATTLRVDGHSVVEATDGLQLLHMLDLGLAGQIRAADVVLADVMMPRLSGLGVLEALHRAQTKPPVILMTVLIDRSVHVVARRLGGAGVLFKPFDADALRRTLARVWLGRAPSQPPGPSTQEQALLARSDATQLRHGR